MPGISSCPDKNPDKNIGEEYVKKENLKSLNLPD
jgi:hypothetical protein